MPSTNSSRVKTTGRGEIEYSDDNTSSSSVQQEAASETGAPEELDVSSVTAMNIGSGEGLFAGSNGSERVVLEFKSLAAGPGILLEDDGQTITIRSTVTGGGNPGTPLGDGFDLVLGDVVNKGDGSWLPGAISLTNTTKVSDAVDSINEVLRKLIPSQPTQFPGGSLSVANVAGTLPLLALGFTDKSQGGHALVAGSLVTRITDTGVASNVFQDVGPGESGTVTLNVNGSTVGSVVLDGVEDSGTYTGLRIADQKDFPVSTPGFWKSIDISAFGAASPVGLNKFRISHTGAGSTADVHYVRDTLTAIPSVSQVAVTEVVAGTLRYSSGVPHYGSGAKLRVAASTNNLSGQTYYGGNDPVTITGTNSIMASQSFGYGAVGVSTPIPVNSVSAVGLTPVEVDVNGNTHGFGWVTVQSRNVNGASAAAAETTATTGVNPTTSYAPFQIQQTKILVIRGGAAGKVDELSIPVSGLGTIPNNLNAVRVGLVGTDRPTGAVNAWDHTVGLNTAEAAVVAGVLMHDQTDYSKSFLPAGPNYSTGRNGAQYFTVEFARSAVSTFKINVAGTYAGCWVRLPGVTDNPAIAPNAAGGWLDASKAYDGAGVPGEAGDTTAGCAQGALMAGQSGSYTMTFGPQTSTNADGNRIQVRIRLNSGQSITSLSFSN